MAIKVIAFDVFGTVFDLSWIDREEVKAYGDHIRSVPWRPLTLPAHWNVIPAHADAFSAIRMLREKYTVVTLSNGPMRLLTELSKHNGISWDAIVPIEMAQVYKPNPVAYTVVTDLFRCMPSEVLMVTANKTFGDLEAATLLGMPSYWIDRKGGKTIYDLVSHLITLLPNP